MQPVLLEVNNLRIEFQGRQQVTTAVKGIDFKLQAGKTLAIVGESGSGKSVTAMALTQLLPDPPMCRATGQILYKGQDTFTMQRKALQALRGKQIAYIFQEPASSLNPVYTVGFQIAEAIRLHLPDVTNVKERVIDAMTKVGIRDAEKRYKAYPHEMSGGMQQRIMIAMALACEPHILVADEPTTALDVTIQKQIIDLLKKVRRDLNMAILLITHNFGIIKDFADDVLVMYRGTIVERGPTQQILEHPAHPYTRALIGCIPRIGARQNRLKTVERTF